jgi:hypothetical protein
MVESNDGITNSTSDKDGVDRDKFLGMLPTPIIIDCAENNQIML